MSRYYRASVSITKSRSGSETAIAEALMDYWGFEDVVAIGNELVSDADGNLTGGTTEDEFARDLTQRVWTAIRGFCEVVVTMTYLEDLPYEEYVFSSQDEYDEWLKASGDGSSVSS